jgi:hypothetical protein
VAARITSATTAATATIRGLIRRRQGMARVSVRTRWSVAPSTSSLTMADAGRLSPDDRAVSTQRAAATANSCSRCAEARCLAVIFSASRSCAVRERASQGRVCGRCAVLHRMATAWSANWSCATDQAAESGDELGARGLEISEVRSWSRPVVAASESRLRGVPASASRSSNHFSRVRAERSGGRGRCRPRASR